MLCRAPSAKVALRIPPPEIHRALKGFDCRWTFWNSSASSADSGADAREGSYEDEESLRSTWYSSRSTWDKHKGHASGMPKYISMTIPLPATSPQSYLEPWPFNCIYSCKKVGVWLC